MSDNKNEVNPIRYLTFLEFVEKMNEKAGCKTKMGKYKTKKDK